MTRNVHPLLSTVSHYSGGRDGLVEALQPFSSARIQIVDLAGPSAPTSSW